MVVIAAAGGGRQRCARDARPAKCGKVGGLVPAQIVDRHPEFGTAAFESVKQPEHVVETGCLRRSLPIKAGVDLEKITEIDFADHDVSTA
jgi:hypothetical protein